LGKTPISLPSHTLDSGKTAEVSGKKSGFFIPTAPLFLCNAGKSVKTGTEMPKGGRVGVVDSLPHSSNNFRNWEHQLLFPE
jgi:hypothetical protein